nr:reverse transcriptase domain-containing protein [Tanacetum cinerariifolium]
MHTRASNSELVEPLPEPERTLNRRLHRRNKRVPFNQKNNPPQHLRIVYLPILNINYFRRFLDILQNSDPMDDEPMWAADRVVTLTPDSTITILETANEFAIKERQHDQQPTWVHHPLDQNFEEYQESDGSSGNGSTSSELEARVCIQGRNCLGQFARKLKAYQPPQAHNEHVNVIFTRSGKSYNPPNNQDDQQNKSENPINFDSDDEDNEPTPQPKTQPTKSFKETLLPKPYKPNIPYPQRYNPPDNPDDNQNNSETPINLDSDDEDNKPTPQPKTQPTKSVKETPLPKPYKPKITYPQCLGKDKMEALYRKFLDMIRVVRNNVPFVDALTGMPNYGKFLKELIRNKHKFEQISTTFLSDESSAMIQTKFPPKLGDLGSFLIPCKFTFPADFIILEMEEDIKVLLILGRPFLHIADAVIRVKHKQLNLGVGTERMIFYRLYDETLLLKR